MAENKKAGPWIWVAVGAVVVLAGVGYWLRRGEGLDEPAGNGAAEALQVHFGEEVARVVAGRQDWDLAFRPWIGREVGDFAFVDIDGNEHRISDFKGKNAVLVFWATWCPACRVEVPHLIALREAVGEDELEIVAVSQESVDELRAFAEGAGINYVVGTVDSELPEPFAGVRSIPMTFFVDPEGRLKVAALGVISTEESLAIVRAGG